MVVSLTTHGLLKHYLALVSPSPAHMDHQDHWSIYFSEGRQRNSGEETINGGVRGIKLTLDVRHRSLIIRSAFAVGKAHIHWSFFPRDLKYEH